jgi:hypothetical protein
MLLSNLISEIVGEKDPIFIEISATQRVKTGKPALLKNSSIFAKNLHHGFSRGVDIIVICIDNDTGSIDDIGKAIQEKISEFFRSFCKKNLHYSKIPCLVCAVPVITMDYWMRALSEKNTECLQIRSKLHIPKERIKEETYGEKNVFRGKFIDDTAIQKKIKEIRKDGSLIKLRCIPSFEDFEKQLINCLNI